MTTLNGKPHYRLRSNGVAALVEYRAPIGKSLLPVPTRFYPSSTSGSGGWVTVISESFAGAWQTNVEVRSARDLLSFPPVYACVTLIAGDIAKLRMRLTARNDEAGIWQESGVPSSSPFLLPLRNPNDYQTPYQFWTAWVISRLLWGNTYVLKERDGRGGFGTGNVRRMHVLDPGLVRAMVSDDGEVFYELRRDGLSGVDQDSVIVPASEIMHDRVTPLWHPLVGVAPLYAAALSGTQGVNIQNNSASFFANMSRPAGLINVPGAISKEQASSLKAIWDATYGPNGSGGTAVLSDGMKYDPLSMSADDSQLTDQWKLTALGVCMAFHVPPYKIGIDAGLKFSNMQQQDMDYYKQCLQTHIESLEQTLDSGLGVPTNYRSEFDTGGLLRMDPLARAQAAQAAIGASYLAPNEARADEDLPPVDGGNQPLSQQQNWPLGTLAERDPPSSPTPAPVPDPNAAARDALAEARRDLEFKEFLVECQRELSEDA